MAIIPQFNGGAAIPVAQQNAPVLDRERRPRVDASEIQQALGASAQAFSQAGEVGQMPTTPINAEDPLFNGIGAIAQGAQNLNIALGGIALKRAEAKNYADVTESITAMEVMRDNFKTFQLENKDRPELWSGEWSDRVASFEKGYQANEELAPAARREIDQRLSRFSQMGSIEVEHAATQATFKRAAEAGKAQHLRLVASGNLEGMMSNLDKMESAGYLAPDDRVVLELNGADDIMGKNREALSTQVETLMLMDRVDEARQSLTDADPEIFGGPKEKKLKLLEFKVQVEAKKRMETLRELIFEDPVKGKRDLAQRKGDYGKLTNEEAFEMNSLADEVINETQRDLVSIFENAVAKGDPNPMSKFSEKEKEMLSPKILESMNDYLEKAQLNDLGRASSIRSKIWSFQPGTPVSDQARTDLQAEIGILFKGEERDALLQEQIDAEEFITSALDRAPLQAALKDGISNLVNEIDYEFKQEMFGSYVVPTSELRWNGAGYWQRLGPNGEHLSIEISPAEQRDLELAKKGNGVDSEKMSEVTDQKARSMAARKSGQIQQSLIKAYMGNEFETIGKAQEFLKVLMDKVGNEHDDAKRDRSIERERKRPKAQEVGLGADFNIK